METSLLFSLGDIIFYLAVVATSLYTLVLAYHWFSYGSSNKVSAISLLVFISGVGLAFLGMWLSLQTF